MPIRFRCQQCHQLLSVGSRKSGSEIECPKCGVPQVVPPRAQQGLETGASSAEISSPERPLGPGDAASEDTPSGEDAVVVVPVPPVAAVPRVVAAAPVVPPAAQPSPAAADVGPPLPSDLILFPRRVVYVQAVLLLAVIAAAFGAGYYIGRGDATYKLQQEAACGWHSPLTGG